MADRKANFDRLVEDYDEKQLPKVLDFKEHRFVTVERDSVSGATFVRGHKSMRGACGYLSRSVEGCERFIPERVIDLDTEEVHELDVFAFVAPKSVEAVAVMMPRDAAELARQVLDEDTRARTEAGHHLAARSHQAADAFRRALERRSG